MFVYLYIHEKKHVLQTLSIQYFKATFTCYLLLQETVLKCNLEQND